VSVLTDIEVLARFPSSLVTHDNIVFYRGLLERRLMLMRCASCEAFAPPQFRTCPRCQSRDTIPTEIDGRGTVFMFTFLYQGVPEGFTAPHPVVTCELDQAPGMRFTSTIIECPRDAVRVGLPVELRWIDVAGNPAPVFSPRATA
jgi:uncharacterized OB-fold protein